MNIKNVDYSPKYVVEAAAVLHELGNYMLADGFEIVYDVSKSHGVYLHDAITGKDYLDFFTCFASNPAISSASPDNLRVKYFNSRFSLDKFLYCLASISV